MPPKRTQFVCSVDGCERDFRDGAMVRGMCRIHYGRLQRTGDPTKTERIVGAPVERFWSKVEKTETCWLWTGTQKGNGYGQFTIDRQLHLAHRFAYELLVGPIPDGFHIDHLCRVRLCVRPTHLEAVTQEENNHRIAQETCRRGHERTPEDTWLNPKTGARVCLPCKRARERARAT